MTDKNEIKKMVKESLYELVFEEPSEIRNVLLDALEDRALGKAMKEAEGSDEVARAEIFNLLP